MDNEIMNVIRIPERVHPPHEIHDISGDILSIIQITSLVLLVFVVVICIIYILKSITTHDTKKNIYSIFILCLASLGEFLCVFIVPSCLVSIINDGGVVNIILFTLAIIAIIIQIIMIVFSCILYKKDNWR